MKKKTTTETTQESKKAPAHTAKAGSVHASVFVNKTKDGKEFASAVINRRYLGLDGKWKSSDSYSTKHLGKLAEVIASVAVWMENNYPEAAK
jgi:hypothetical protein